MKRLLFTIASVLCFLQPAEIAAQTRIEAILIPKEGGPVRIWIHEVGNDGFRYYDTPQTTALTNFAFNRMRSIFFPESRIFNAAMQQFRARDYQGARESFAKVAEEFRVVRGIPNNPSSRAAFFEIECHRLLGEYAKMSEKMGAFNKSGISRENELRQLELNLMWEAVGREAWDSLDSLVRKHVNAKMPANQRAQVAYLAGLVEEKKGNTTEAIEAYNEAMIIDAAASEVVARMAALGILRIHDADPEVQTARKVWGTDDSKPNSSGYQKLVEAGAVARIYEAFVSAGSPLPDAFKAYLDFKAPVPES